MAKLTISLLLLFSLHSLYLLHSSASTTKSIPQPDFIKTECQTTRYAALCFRSLSNYSATSHQQLAQAAVSVSLSRAQAAATFVSKLAKMKDLKRLESGAVKDCVQNMGDAVDQLTRSVKELDGMGRVNGQDFNWHVSNVESWVSTALTNQNMCVNGFSSPSMDGNVKVAVTKRVLDSAQTTSNALALVNRFAARHRL